MAGFGALLGVVLRFHKIQALRAVAAILVAIDHSLTFLAGHPWPMARLEPVAWFLGEQGVATFFVISGFIMTCTTGGKFGSAQASARFLKHRVLRVVPLYWLYTAVSTALIGSGLWLKGRSITGLDVARSLAFVPYGDGVHPMRPVLGQGWTLNYEMLFYLMFACAMLAPRRAGLAAVIGVLLVLGAGGAVWGVSLSGVDPLTAVQFYLAPHMVLFAAGIAIGEGAMWARRAGRAVLPAWAAGHALGVVLVGYAGAALLFLGMVNTTAIVLPWRLAFWAVDAAAVAICALALEARAGDRGEAVWERLGDASYSIYLVHFFALTVAAKLWGSVLHWRWPAGFMVAAPAAGVIAGLIAYQYIERPMSKALRRLTDRRPTVAAQDLCA